MKCICFFFCVYTCVSVNFLFGTNAAMYIFLMLQIIVILQSLVSTINYFVLFFNFSLNLY